MTQLWRQARYEVSLPRGFTGVCNVGLEFDLWETTGSVFLDHVRKLDPCIAISLWPGEQRQIDRWLNIGLIDIAFCYAPQSAENFSTRILFDDEIILVSDAPGGGGGDYVFVDHGDEFRRQHAEAYPSDTTSAITIASAAWAIDHLLAWGGRGYVPRRHARALLDEGRLHQVPSAPSFSRRAYVVEAGQATRGWTWFPAALDAVRSAMT